MSNIETSSHASSISRNRYVDEIINYVESHTVSGFVPFYLTVTFRLIRNHLIKIPWAAIPCSYLHPANRDISLESLPYQGIGITENQVHAEVSRLFGRLDDWIFRNKRPNQDPIRPKLIYVVEPSDEGALHAHGVLLVHQCRSHRIRPNDVPVSPQERIAIETCDNLKRDLRKNGKDTAIATVYLQEVGNSREDLAKMIEYGLKRRVVLAENLPIHFLPVASTEPRYAERQCEKEYVAATQAERKFRKATRRSILKWGRVESGPVLVKAQ